MSANDDVMPVLRTEHLRKAFSTSLNHQVVLRDLDLRVDDGEFLAIVGASGSGKSTLLGILGCLDKPDGGKYFVQGELVDWRSSRQLAQLRGGTLATVFQGFELIPHWSVAENVGLGLRYRPVPRDVRMEIVVAMLREVGMLRQMHKHPAELSGGEQQRVAIARALCGSPKVLLADEPTGNLDAKTAGDFFDLFLRLNEQGTTILMVTHDEALAGRCRRVLTLSGGAFQ